MSGHSEGEPHIHPGRIALYGGVDISLASREVNDLIEFGTYLRFSHPENRPVEIDILSSCQFGVKSCPNFQEGGDPPLHSDLAGGGSSYA